MRTLKAAADDDQHRCAQRSFALGSELILPGIRVIGAIGGSEHITECCSSFPARDLQTPGTNFPMVGDAESCSKNSFQRSVVRTRFAQILGHYRTARGQDRQ